MKKLYVPVIISLFVLINLPVSLFAQLSQGGSPVSFSTSGLSKSIDIRQIKTPDMEQAIMEDYENDGFGKAYRIGVLLPVDLNPENSGTWETLPDGNLLWRLQVEMDGAEASSLYFDKYTLPSGAKLFVYTVDKSHVIGAFTEVNNHESGLMATEMIPGGSFVIELTLPYDMKDQLELLISEVGYNYRSTGFNVTDKGDLSCMVNVKCPTANTWQSQVNSVARVQIRIGSGNFLCTGSLVTTTLNDCQPYFLLADHCAYYSSYATASNLNQWVFNFNYQASTCEGTSGTTAQSLTGCTMKAHDTYGSTSNGSDFYLVLLNNSIPSTYQPYYNGWNKTNSAASSGAGIHHPEGVIKKYSIFSSTLQNYTTHWQVYWANQPGYGHSVTAEGSSGSPIFDQNKLVVGTLTGGSSFCTSTGSPDYYGKFSYHWQSNGSASDKQLKPWLDPINANPNTKTGVNYNACSGVFVEEAMAPNLNINLYPNPADDKLFLSFENYHFDSGTVRIIDVLGNTVAQIDVHSYSDEIEIPVHHLSGGLYFINANNADHHFSGTFMISR